MRIKGNRGRAIGVRARIQSAFRSRRVITGITLEEVNGHARVWDGVDNRVVLMNGPQKAETTLPDSTAVLAAMDTLSLAEIAPYVDTLADTPLGPDFNQVQAVL